MFNFRHIIILYSFFTLSYLSITGCNDNNNLIPDNDTTVTDTTHKKNVSNLTLTQSVNENIATLTATATNANSYSWDFGNGDTGSGESVQVTYRALGNYWAKCTAIGTTDSLIDSIKVTIKPKPEFLYKEPQRPFPQHQQYYSEVIMPNVEQSVMDAKVISFYRQWRNKYLKTFHDSMAYVHYTLEYSVGNAISCSEGHGFGMVITALMAGADTTAYNDYIKLYRWYDNHRSHINPSLMAWQQNSSGQNSSGADSATDGDLDIAYSLLLAHYQWGSNGDVDFLNEAKKIIEAIYNSDISPTYKFTELGDWVNSGKYSRSTRCCDFMIDHLRAFKNETNNPKWDEIIDTTYNVISYVADSITGLYPDFVIVEDGKFKPCPPNFLEGPNDGDYYFNSCRAPWRIATDYIVNGDTRALQELTRLNRWIIEKTDNKPYKIKEGYKLNGTQLSSWSDMAFTSPFGVCAMVDNENQQWLNDMWSQINSESLNSGAYFGNSIKMICLITMSGNWWKPQTK